MLISVQVIEFCTEIKKILFIRISKAIVSHTHVVKALAKNFQKTKQLLKFFGEKWIFYEIYSYPWCMN